MPSCKEKFRPPQVMFSPLKDVFIIPQNGGKVNERRKETHGNRLRKGEDLEEIVMRKNAFFHFEFEAAFE